MVFNNILSLIKKIFFKLFFNPVYLYVKYFFIELLLGNNYILLRATSYPNNRHFIPKLKTNIGDDINYILIPLIFKKHVVPYQYSLIGRYIVKKENILFIGSIITGLSTSKSIVLGAGVSPDQTSKALVSPKIVKCVRGPLTRKYLQEHNIVCPAIYGDPALLLSLFYTPNQVKKYKIGFILHFLDRKPQVLELLSKYPDCIILDVTNYGNWKQFLNQLCSCELILSSSLHGLIFADTYNIPNIWTHFYFHVNPFKYQDYFLSVGRLCDKPLDLSSFKPLDKLFELRKQYVNIRYNKQKLLDYLKSCHI